MKNLAEIVTEEKSKGEWCLWDYTENGVREILVWKGDGKDQSHVTEIDKDGYELMNVNFKEIEIYCRDHGKHEIDKYHLDFSNADLSKIPSIF